MHELEKDCVSAQDSSLVGDTPFRGLGAHDVTLPRCSLEESDEQGHSTCPHNLASAHLKSGRPPFATLGNGPEREGIVCERFFTFRVRNAFCLSLVEV